MEIYGATKDLKKFQTMVGMPGLLTPEYNTCVPPSTEQSEVLTPPSQPELVSQVVPVAGVVAVTPAAQC